MATSCSTQVVRNIQSPIARPPAALRVQLPLQGSIPDPTMLRHALCRGSRGAAQLLAQRSSFNMPAPKRLDEIVKLEVRSALGRTLGRVAFCAASVRC